MTQWLKAQQAADYAQVSIETIRAAVRSGDLQAFRIGKGREYRLTADTVDEWMTRQSWEPAS